MKKYFTTASVLLSAFVFCTFTAFGQHETATGIEIDKNLELMRRDLRSEMKKLIALNVPLTETEATKFWPVYDQMTAEFAKINDGFYGIIKEYAANQKTLTDEQASAMLKRWSAYQVETAQTRQKYVPLIEKVIPGKKAALFFQINRRLWTLLDLQVASEVPLVLQ